jgi:hypothetical protein
VTRSWQIIRGLGVFGAGVIPYEATAPANSEYVFPHIVDGAGYTTQLILFSGAAGQTSSGTVRLYAVDGEGFNVEFKN